MVGHSERGDDVTSAAASDDGVRAVLEALRTVVEPDDADTFLSPADARVIVSDAWTALSDVLTERREGGAVELLDMLRKLARIDDGLLRARETTRRIGDVLTRLEAVPCSVKAVVGAAPRLIGDLGFDRAIVSGIFDGVWISQGVFIADDPQWAEMINRIGQEQPQTLTPSLFESEVVRRREAVVVDRRPARVPRAPTHRRSLVVALLCCRPDCFSRASDRSAACRSIFSGQGYRSRRPRDARVLRSRSAIGVEPGGRRRAAAVGEQLVEGGRGGYGRGLERGFTTSRWRRPASRPLTNRRPSARRRACSTALCVPRGTC